MIFRLSQVSQIDLTTFLSRVKLNFLFLLFLFSLFPLFCLFLILQINVLKRFFFDFLFLLLFYLFFLFMFLLLRTFLFLLFLLGRNICVGSCKNVLFLVFHVSEVWGLILKLFFHSFFKIIFLKLLFTLLSHQQQSIPPFLFLFFFEQINNLYKM